jgi:hypothetical protein
MRESALGFLYPYWAVQIFLGDSCFIRLRTNEDGDAVSDQFIAPYTPRKLGAEYVDFDEKSW